MIYNNISLMRHLLKNYQGERLQRLCALWVLKKEEWADYLPYTYPEKNKAVMEYEALSAESKKKLPKQFFIDHPEVNSYYSRCRAIKVHNHDRLGRLTKIMRLCPGHTEQIQERQRDFRKCITYNHTQEIIPILERTYQKPQEEAQEERPTQKKIDFVTNIARQFGGGGAEMIKASHEELIPTDLKIYEKKYCLLCNSEVTGHYAKMCISCGRIALRSGGIKKYMRKLKDFEKRNCSQCVWHHFTGAWSLAICYRFCWKRSGDERYMKV